MQTTSDTSKQEIQAKQQLPKSMLINLMNEQQHQQQQQQQQLHNRSLFISTGDQVTHHLATSWPPPPALIQGQHHFFHNPTQQQHFINHHHHHHRTSPPSHQQQQQQQHLWASLQAANHYARPLQMSPINKLQQHHGKMYSSPNPSQNTHSPLTLITTTPPSSQTPSSASVSSADSLSPTLNNSTASIAHKIDCKLSPISDQSLDDSFTRLKSKQKSPAITTNTTPTAAASAAVGFMNQPHGKRKRQDNNIENNINNNNSSLNHIQVFARGTPIIVSTGKTIPIEELNETHFRTYEKDFNQHLVNNCLFSNISNSSYIKQQQQQQQLQQEPQVKHTTSIIDQSNPNTCSFKTLITNSILSNNNTQNSLNNIKLTLCSILKYNINEETQTGCIEFLVDELKTNITMRNIPLEMPLFERKKRWTSMSPQRTYTLCSLVCKLLESGDQCMMLLDHNANNNTSKPSNASLVGTLKNSDSLHSDSSCSQEHTIECMSSVKTKRKQEQQQQQQQVQRDKNTHKMTSSSSSSSKSSKKHKPEKYVCESNNDINNEEDLRHVFNSSHLNKSEDHMSQKSSLSKINIECNELEELNGNKSLTQQNENDNVPNDKLSSISTSS